MHPLKKKKNFIQYVESQARNKRTFIYHFDIQINTILDDNLIVNTHLYPFISCYILHCFVYTFFNGRYVGMNLISILCNLLKKEISCLAWSTVIRDKRRSVHFPIHGSSINVNFLIGFDMCLCKICIMSIISYNASFASLGMSYWYPKFILRCFINKIPVL